MRVVKMLSACSKVASVVAFLSAFPGSASATASAIGTGKFTTPLRQGFSPTDYVKYLISRLSSDP